MRPVPLFALCAALLSGASLVVPLPAHAQTAPAQTLPGQTLPDQTGRTDTRALWEKVKGVWHQTQGTIKEQWGKLTDDDLLAIEGRRDQLVGKLQSRYGITREQAEGQVRTWEHKQMRQM
jgi:uncharacterized protein YjbJ (UPF0337 family)